MKDCQWLCNLLQLGLLKGSFVPPEDIRNLRDLTRYEVKLQHQLTGHKNRIHKILHECNNGGCADNFWATSFSGSGTEDQHCGAGSRTDRDC